MKNNVLFKGIMPALVTPLNENGKVNKGVLKELIDWQISCGVNGFYICGSTGEGLLLDKKQRMDMLEYTLDAVDGRAPVIDHIGDVDLDSTIELARHAASAGAAAVSSIPPIYFAYSDDDVFEFYRAVTDACPLPMLMYGYPGAKSISLDLVKRLMGIDNVVGMKWTYNDYYGMERAKSINCGNINIINGPDESLIAGLAVGADAGIGTTYNIMPGMFVKLYNAFHSGDVVRARALQHGINNVISELVKFNAIATTKAVLCHMGYDVGECVRPIKHLSSDEKNALIKAVCSAVDLERQDIYDV